MSLNNNQANQCPACGSSKSEPNNQAAHMLGLQKPYMVVSCAGCGLNRLTPQLNASELKKLYAQGYFDSSNAVNIENDQCALHDDYSRVVEGRYSKFESTLETLRSGFPLANTLLDVGAATGDMVHLAQLAGFEAEGIEFSDFAVKQAKDKFGLDLKQYSLAEVATQSYDLVHLNHVFEHFNDPVGELKNLHRILKPEGGMYIEIPFQFHLIERLKHRLKPEAPPFSLHSIHHSYFYTPSIIRRMLWDSGFKIARLSVFSADRYPNSTLSEKAKLIMWGLLSLVRIGNYIEIIAVKREDGVVAG